MKHNYVKIAEADLPQRVFFTTPRRNQGQAIEEAYGDLRPGEHDVGDLYKSVHDRSINSTVYYRRADEKE